MNLQKPYNMIFIALAAGTFLIESGFCESLPSAETPVEIPATPTPWPTINDESPVGIPGLHEASPPVKILDKRFEAKVIARGVLTESILAVHPQTGDVYFTEYDYREAYYPHRLFRIPSSADNVYVPQIDPITSIPVVNQYVLYPNGMAFDFEGALYISSKWSFSESLTVLQSDGSYQTIPFESAYQIKNLRVVQQDLSNYGVSRGDILLLQTLYADANPRNLPVSRLAAYRPSTKQTIPLFESYERALSDFVVGSEETIYFLGINPAAIYRLRDAVLESVTGALSGSLPSAPNGKIEYLDSDRAFFVLLDTQMSYPYESFDHSLLRVSEDGNQVGAIIDNAWLVNIKAAPDGKTLYVINQYRWRYGSIQALQLINPTPAITLEEGDLNDDGLLDAQDVSALLDAFLLERTLLPNEMESLDFNRDGFITPQDVQDLWKRIFPQ